MKQSEFKQRMANRYCRKCINEQLGTDLSTEDCCYAIYPNKCQKCGDMRNIVESLHWSARHKIVFAKGNKLD